MTTAATKALILAQQMLDTLAAADIDEQGLEIDGQTFTADEIRSVIRRGVESLRQGPLMLDSIEVHRRLRDASKAAGSDAALASKMGITRQSLAAVMSGLRSPGPSVLTFLKLRRVPTGRTLYTPIETAEIKPKPPRSERRQRAWDGPAAEETDRAPRP